MDLKKKFIIIIFGGLFLMAGLTVLFTYFIHNAVSNPKPILKSWYSEVPVFESGLFTEDGDYFVYTYRPEVERPDVKGNVIIRGISFPAYFQIMETATGKKLFSEPYASNKTDPMFVITTEGDLVWLLRMVYHSGNRLALYDIKARKFLFQFGELEKINAPLSWEKNSLFFVNTTGEKGLILEANDKRYYRIDPNSGKAVPVQGKQKLAAKWSRPELQTSDRIAEFKTDRINGDRESITGSYGKPVSDDDFIEVHFLTLTKNDRPEEGPDGYPLTYYKDHFFVLSPLTSDNEKDKELAMLEKNGLKTVWKIQLPQKLLKTIIPKYVSERFFLKDNRLYVTNNDYLMVIDLDKGEIIKQTGLYD